MNIFAGLKLWLPNWRYWFSKLAHHHLFTPLLSIRFLVWRNTWRGIFLMMSHLPLKAGSIVYRKLFLIWTRGKAKKTMQEEHLLEKAIPLTQKNKYQLPKPLPHEIKELLKKPKLRHCWVSDTLDAKLYISPRTAPWKLEKAGPLTPKLKQKVIITALANFLQTACQKSPLQHHQPS